MSESVESPQTVESPVVESVESPKPPRNPIEKVIVWGLILVGVIIVFFEASARFSYGITLNRISSALEADGGEDHQALELDQAKEMVLLGKQVDSMDGRAFSSVTYEWNGLLKKYGTIEISYDTDDKTVLGLTTADAPIEEIPEPEMEDSGGSEEGMVDYGDQYGAENGGGGERPARPQRPGGDTSEESSTEESSTEESSTEESSTEEPSTEEPTSEESVPESSESAETEATEET